MTLPEMRAMVKDELERIPRGTDVQNFLRALYWTARMNSLSKKPQGPTDRLGVLQYAIEAVRRHIPSAGQFEFQYDRPFFRGA
jgi:hypothetical protein